MTRISHEELRRRVSEALAQVDRAGLLVPAEQFEEERILTEKACPKELPAGWKRIVEPGGLSYGFGLFTYYDNLSVLLSVGLCDAKHWVHVSCTVDRGRQLPTYQDLSHVKDVFIGKDRQAVQIFARQAEHVNIHPNVLHLWACLSLEGDGLPRFGMHGSI